MAFKYRMTQAEKAGTKICLRNNAMTSLPRVPLSKLETRGQILDHLNTSRSIRIPEEGEGGGQRGRGEFFQ